MDKNYRRECGREGVGRMKGGKWDNCNSIINKYIFLKRKETTTTKTHVSLKETNLLIWASWINNSGVNVLAWDRNVSTSFYQRKKEREQSTCRSAYMHSLVDSCTWPHRGSNESTTLLLYLGDAATNWVSDQGLKHFFYSNSLFIAMAEVFLKLCSMKHRYLSTY